MQLAPIELPLTLSADIPIVSAESPQAGKRFKKRARKRHWTDEEDEALKKGFHQYGYDWARIVKDPDLHFENRSSGQVRDRFRLKFKEVYANEAVARTLNVADNQATTQVNEQHVAKQGEQSAELFTQAKYSEDAAAAQDMTARTKTFGCPIPSCIRVCTWRTKMSPWLR